MKKFWNLMLVALVMLGAAACTETNESVDASKESLSFYAEISNDATRADLEYDEQNKNWKTVWEGNETIVVKNASQVYNFVNSAEEPAKFTCTEAGVSQLVGQSVNISIASAEQSKVGKRGVTVSVDVEAFDNSKTIKLEATNSFLRYTYNGEGKVALTLTYEGGQAFVYNEGQAYDSVEFEGVKGENFVSFNAPAEGAEAELAYSIDGMECKRKAINVFAGKVYNLGELTLPYAVSAKWGIAGAFNGWTAGTPEPLYEVGDMLVAYNLTKLNDGFKFVQDKGWDGAKGSKNQDAVASGEWLYSGEYDIKTADASAYDVYFVPSRSMYCIVAAGSTAPELPAVEPIVWSLAGSFNNWGDTLMTATDAANLFVAKNVELKSGDEIKVKDSKTWDTSYGGGINNLEANKWMKAYFNGSNVVVAKSGSYDVYFEYAEGAEYSKLYLVEADGDYTAAVEQTENGTLVPDGGDEPEQPEVPEEVTIGLVGSFQDWNVASPMPMEYVGDGWIVASGIELYKTDEFKFVNGTSWDLNYGSKDAVLVAESGKEYTLVSDGGQNIKVNTNGKFDIYFNITSKNFKYECVEKYDITVNITIDNKANWSPLYIHLEESGVAITPAEGALVENNKYAVSGDYIGSTLTCKFTSGSKTSDVMSVTISKTGATVTLEETVVKLYFKLNTSNSKQWWGATSKIHVWNTGTSFDTSWPGNTMTNEGNYTWSIIVPSELVGKKINYLIHNGNGWQSKDSTVTIKAEGVTVTGSSIGIN